MWLWVGMMQVSRANRHKCMCGLNLDVVWAGRMLHLSDGWRGAARGRLGTVRRPKVPVCRSVRAYA